MYRRLQEAGLTGDVCPLYYGHYVLDYDGFETDLRRMPGRFAEKTVPAILLEYVNGYTLHKFKRLQHDDEYVSPQLRCWCGLQKTNSATLRTKIRVVQGFVNCHKKLFAARIQQNSVKDVNLLVSADGHKSYVIDFGRATPHNIWSMGNWIHMRRCLAPIVVSLMEQRV